MLRWHTGGKIAACHCPGDCACAARRNAPGSAGLLHCPKSPAWLSTGEICLWGNPAEPPPQFCSAGGRPAQSRPPTSSAQHLDRPTRYATSLCFFMATHLQSVKLWRAGDLLWTSCLAQAEAISQRRRCLTGSTAPAHQLHPVQAHAVARCQRVVLQQANQCSMKPPRGRLL